MCTRISYDDVYQADMQVSGDDAHLQSMRRRELGADGGQKWLDPFFLSGSSILALSDRSFSTHWIHVSPYRVAFFVIRLPTSMRSIMNNELDSVSGLDI